MGLIPITTPIPFTHFVNRAVDIPAIDIATIERTHTDRIDVTTFASEFREYTLGPINAYGKDGSLIYRGGPEPLQIALKGGGRYFDISANGEFTAQTEAEHEAELDAQAEADAMDWY